MSALLTCSGVDAGYVPGRPVLRDVNITLEAGQVLALLGPNGAGKTTLMLTIAGLQAPLAGSIGLGGVTVRPGSPRAAVKAGLVLVPDDRSLFKGLTVTENLRLASRRGSATTSERIFGYFPELKRRVKVAAGDLSGGEQQMLAIGRALMQDPKVLLVDELSMGLAPVIVETLLPVIRQVADDTGAACVLVEQHVMLALEIADTAIVLAHGDVALQGEARALAADGTLIERAYLGAAEANGAVR
ncbi:MAG TPA: ABC transporter ATP-binding protein [Streptosporangiaceae bacterium]|jgi:branched-chain amino acid transport system ATP-binding protein|nr:ABC transporter ATP-binding protein [Streptosporangiaceae bacterium]